MPDTIADVGAPESAQPEESDQAISVATRTAPFPKRRKPEDSTKQDRPRGTSRQAAPAAGHKRQREGPGGSFVWLAGDAGINPPTESGLPRGAARPDLRPAGAAQIGD